jgi:hypothetical protein
MKVLETSPPAAARRVLNQLGVRRDTADRRIQIMQILVGKLTEADGVDLARAKADLGAALLTASRPAEAASHLGEAYDVMAGVNDQQAHGVWRTWVQSLLAADDPGVVVIMSDVESDADYADGLASLMARATTLLDGGEPTRAIPLLAAALDQLPHRLTGEQIALLEAMLARAEESEREAESARVATLVSQLTAPDEPARKAAVDELQAMGQRAVDPLLVQLLAQATATPVDTAKEKAILDVLEQVAPALEGYDPRMPTEAKITLVQLWRQNR